MQLFTDPDHLPADLADGVIAIGNFDGVHRGHLIVLDEARAIAETLGSPLGVMSFEPHPRRFFRPDGPPFRLTPFRQRADLLCEAGADFHVVLTFDEPFSRLSPEAFVDRYLMAGLAARHVAVGYDFHFGHDRAGSPAVLARLGEERGFGVTVVTQAGDEAGHVFSSSRARECLAAGDMAGAAEILGRPWAIRGRVERGDQRGRVLGFPTANLPLGEYQRPAFGIYAVRCRLDGESGSRPGVASLGIRPMWRTDEPLLEVHLFDFDADIYDRCLDVELVAHLRPEQTFASVEALVEQIGQDVERARTILSTG